MYNAVSKKVSFQIYIKNLPEMCGYSLIYQSTFIHTYYECQNHCVQVSDPLSLPTDLVRLALHQDRINQLAFFILITLGESLLSFS